MTNFPNELGCTRYLKTFRSCGTCQGETIININGSICPASSMLEQYQTKGKYGRIAIRNLPQTLRHPRLAQATASPETWNSRCLEKLSHDKYVREVNGYACMYVCMVGLANEFDRRPHDLPRMSLGVVIL